MELLGRGPAADGRWSWDVNPGSLSPCRPPTPGIPVCAGVDASLVTDVGSVGPWSSPAEGPPPGREKETAGLEPWAKWEFPRPRGAGREDSQGRGAGACEGPGLVNQGARFSQLSKIE